MNSVILHAATRLIFPLLLLFSAIVTLNGHNLPGGGFVGGLMAASAFALHSMAFGVIEARRLLRVSPVTLVGAGLSMAIVSGLLSLVASMFGGEAMAFMTGLWASYEFPGIGEIKVGTPLLFDLGVYFTVLGVTLLMVFTLEEVSA